MVPPCKICMDLILSGVELPSRRLPGVYLHVCWEGPFGLSFACFLFFFFRGPGTGCDRELSFYYVLHFFVLSFCISV